MNNLGKIIIGLSLIPSSLLWAGQSDIDLDSYLKDYHPELSKDLEKQGVDLIAVESNAENTIINEENDSDKLTVTSVGHPDYCRNSGGIFLANNYIATCVSKDGTFGTGPNPTGMTFNPSGSHTVPSPDFLRPGTPHEYFSISINGRTYTNNNDNGAGIEGSDNIPTEIKRLNRYANRSRVKEGGVLVKSRIYVDSRSKVLAVTQKYTLDPNSREIIVRVEAHNAGLVELNNIQYARGLDPDQDFPATHSTLNRIGHSFFPSPATITGRVVDVSPNNIAWSEGKNTQLSVALYSVDPVKHNTCISPLWTTEPSEILSRKCGLLSQPIYDRPQGIFGSDYSDSTINIAFSIGDLKVGEKKVFSYKYLFDKSKKR